MLLNGQVINVDEKYYTLTLKEPYWSASQKFEWKEKECGYGISKTLIVKALKDGTRKIKVIYKDDVFEIDPEAIHTFYKNSVIKPVHRARNGIVLIVIPKSLFTLVDLFEL